jgi:hypothetical protein
MDNTFESKGWLVKVTMPDERGGLPQEQYWVSSFERGNEATGSVHSKIVVSSPNANVSLARVLSADEIKSHGLNPAESLRLE